MHIAPTHSLQYQQRACPATLPHSCAASTTSALPRSAVWPLWSSSSQASTSWRAWRKWWSRRTTSPCWPIRCMQSTLSPSATATPRALPFPQNSPKSRSTIIRPKTHSLSLKDLLPPKQGLLLSINKQPKESQSAPSNDLYYRYALTQRNILWMNFEHIPSVLLRPFFPIGALKSRSMDDIIMNLLYFIKNLLSYNKNMSKYSKEDLKKRLTPMQYKVTQENGTEPPYKNEYYKTSTKGVYNCIVCAKALFTSDYKYDSGCGWPAFYDELKEANIVKKVDATHGMVRTEVRCSECDSHLGHLFDDGPQDKTGVRYCINSASINLKPQ